MGYNFKAEGVKFDPCHFFLNSSRDRDHGGPDGMEPDGVIEVKYMLN